MGPWGLSILTPRGRAAQGSGSSGLPQAERAGLLFRGCARGSKGTAWEVTSSQSPEGDIPLTSPNPLAGPEIGAVGNSADHLALLCLSPSSSVFCKTLRYKKRVNFFLLLFPPP